eukprot:828204-Prymnesium_polylepis.1
MAPTHPLHNYLSPLLMYNLFVASNEQYMGIRPGCELKHVFKRWKERTKSETGMTISEFKFRGSALRRLIVAGDMATAADVDRMFASGFADAQRVAPMVMLLRTVGRMGDMKPADFGSEQLLFANSSRGERD